MHYRRARSAGATCFFTVNLADRNSCLLAENAPQLYNILQQVRQRHPFRLHALVILPDHLHTLWTLPAGDSDYPTRWSLIKAAFSRHIPRDETIDASHRSKRERGLWQRRYWEHQIRDESDLQRHIDYIHFNPVRHGHTSSPADWPYSSIHQYIRNGILPGDWGGGVEPAAGMEFGERR